jgi:hypothetical protein
MADYYNEVGPREQPFPSDLSSILESERPKDYDAAIEGAIKDTWVPFAVKRIYERRSSQFGEDKDWVIPDSAKAEIDLQYDKKETKLLEGSKSENEFLANKRFIQEDRDRREAVAQAGLFGTVSEIAFGLIDPTFFLTGGITGALSASAKTTGLLKAARVATLSGIESAAIESVLVAGDTQRDAHGILTAFAGGALIGGAMSPLFKAKKPNKAKVGDMVDNAVMKDAETSISKDFIDAFEKKVSDVDDKKIRSRIDNYEVGLKTDYETGPGWPTQNIRKAKESIREMELKLAGTPDEITAVQGKLKQQRDSVLEAQSNFIKEVEPQRAAIKAEYSKRIEDQRLSVKKAEKRVLQKDNPKNQAKLWKEEEKLRELSSEQAVRLAEIESKLKGKVAEAEFKFKQKFNRMTKETLDTRNNLIKAIEETRDNVSKAIRSRKAGKELQEWSKLSDDEKISKLFGDEVPRKSSEVARQVRGFKDIDPNIKVSVEETTGVDLLPNGVEASTVSTTFEPSLGSAGAAQAGFRPLKRVYDIGEDAQAALTRFAHDGGLVPDDLRGRRILPKFTKAVQSIQTRLSNSDNMVVRGLSYHLFEAGQGGTSNPNGTAALMSDIYGKKFRTAMRGRLKDGMDLWRQNQGISQLDMIMKPSNSHSFYKKVMIEVRHPGSFSDEGIALAAEGVRDQLAMAGKTRKNMGEGGFENIDLERNYITTIVDENLIKSATMQHGKEKVTELLSESYQRGKYSLDKKTADYIARGYVARSLDNTLGLSTYAPSITTADIDKIRAALESAKVPRDVIDELLSETAEQNMSKSMSNRAKKSFEPDLTTELNGLKMIDLVESDLPKLLEAYTREAAGGSAMARLGFKTKRQAMEFLREVKKGADNNGLNPAVTNEEIQVLEDGINLIYGRSINPDPSSQFVKNLSRVRDATAFLRLQTMGISTIPELARVTGQRGLSNVLEACPDLGVFLGTKGLREGKTFAGKLTRADLAELEEMLYYVGEDYVMYPGYLRVDNIEESSLYHSLGNKVDLALSQGRKVQEVVSAFRQIQGSGEKLAVRSLGIQIKKWADGIGGALSESNINDAGWHGGFMDELKSWMSANPKSAMHNERDIRLFNFGKMPPDMQEKLVMGMHRLVMRDMQRPLVGESSVFMNKWFGQTLTQFRNFSILSLGKQLMHDIRHDQIAGSIIALHSIMMSAAAYGISTLHNGFGRPNQDEYFEKAFSPSALMMGVFNRMGQVASLGLAGDFFATLSMLPDSMMASPGKPGFRSMDATAVPVIGAIGDAKDAAADAFKLFKGDVKPSKALKDLQRVLPFGKAIGINQAFNAIEGALD